MKRRQLREYVRDIKPPCTKAKLYGEYVILYKNKIHIPKTLQELVANWYTYTNMELID